MSDLAMIGSSTTTLLATVLALSAATLPASPGPSLPPFLPARPYELPVPRWQRISPRGHYRQRRPGRR